MALSGDFECRFFWERNQKLGCCIFKSLLCCRKAEDDLDAPAQKALCLGKQQGKVHVCSQEAVKFSTGSKTNAPFLCSKSLSPETSATVAEVKDVGVRQPVYENATREFSPITWKKFDPPCVREIALYCMSRHYFPYEPFRVRRADNNNLRLVVQAVYRILAWC